MSDEIKETAVIIAELLTAQLGVKADRIFLANQKWKIPPDDGLFVEVALLSGRPYGTGISYSDAEVAGEGVLQECQTINMQEIYTIMLFSRDASARKLATQGALTFALNGTQAQQACEQYSMQFAALPFSLVDVSEVEASARLNKFAYTFNVLRSYSRAFIAESFKQYASPPYSLLINP